MVIWRIIEAALRLGERLANRRDQAATIRRLEAERDAAQDRAQRAEVELEAQRLVALERGKRGMS